MSLNEIYPNDVFNKNLHMDSMFMTIGNFLEVLQENLTVMFLFFLIKENTKLYQN